MDDQDRNVSTGERPHELSKENQRDLSKDERAAPAKRAPPALVTGTSSHVAAEQPKPSDGGGELSDGQLLDLYGPDGQCFGSSGYDWSAYQRYLTSDGMHIVSPVMYGDNASLMYHSGYGYNPELAYGQYSPVAAPLGSFYVDGPMYSPQQVPFSPSYYPQPSPPSLAPMSSAFPATPTEQRTSESSSTDNMAFGSGSGYFVDYRSFSGADLSGNVSSPLPSPGIYPQPMGILGSYEQSIGQISHPQRSMHGYGMAASPFTGRYPHNTSHQTSTFGGPYYPFGNDRGRLTVDKGRRGERDWDSVSVYSNSNDNSNDRNRGPRASKLKDKTTSDQESSSIARKTDLSAFGINIDTINRKDFITDYEEAKFFIIKSFSEDNVHKSIKYSVWASTPHGNKKLDAAYHEAKSSKNSCPVFLLFSVNASGQFCGVAEMVGPVDFEKDADYWQQDRWNGQFPVQWHIIKDVPNNRFRHILLENNDNKPVTHSRDCQEVNLNQGIELLKIFNDYDARTSIIDDFDFYDDRERCLKERKARQQVCANKDASDTLATDAVKEVSDISNQALEMKGSSGKESAEHEHESTSITESVVHEQDDVQKISDSLSQVLQLEESEKELAPSSENVVAPDSELVDEKVTVV